MITTFKPLQIVAAVLMALMLAVAPFPATAGDLLVYTALEDDEIPRYLALLFILPLGRPRGLQWPSFWPKRTIPRRTWSGAPRPPA